MPYAPPLFEHLAKSAKIITRVLEMPCADPITVYLEAAEAIAGGIIWGYVTPDPKEVYHQVAGEPLVHSIREHFHDAFDATGGSFKATRRWIGKFLGATDRFVWWQFLAASAEQGLIEAQGTMRRLAKCDNFHDPNFGSGGPYIFAISDSGEWHNANIAITQPESKFYPVTSSFIEARPNHTAMIAVSAQFEDFNAIPVPTSSKIWRHDTGMDLDRDTNWEGGVSSGFTPHVWYKSRSAFSKPTIVEAQFAYFGGVPLPLHEAFPIADTVNGYFYS